MTISLETLRRCTVAVDMGASRTRVYLRGSGLVVNEPSAAAVNRATGALVAVGTQAEQMAGRTPAHIRVVHPVSGSGITDIDMAQRMLRQMLDVRVRRAWRYRPSRRAVACVPYDAAPLAQRAVIDTLGGVGARRVLLVDTLIAAAVGCGLPVSEPEGVLIVVCGAATTQIAVMSLGNVVAAEKIPVGGEAVSRALIGYFRTHHELLFSTQSARQVHRLVDAADASGHERVEVQGRDVITGLARTVRTDCVRAQQAAASPMVAVLDGIRGVLRQCPPDLVADIGVRGVTLTGGNATMPGLERLLRDAFDLPVHIADQPGNSAILGLGSMLAGTSAPPSDEDGTPLDAALVPAGTAPALDVSEEKAG